jgi:hypothetical protein
MRELFVWEKLGCVPYPFCKYVHLWYERDANVPPPTVEEDEDGGLYFYNPENGRPRRALCEFEKDLLTLFWSQHNPGLPIPSIKDLNIWHQTLPWVGLEDWNAYVVAHQTAAQKEERDDSIQAHLKMMHDVFWHKERNCACRASYLNRKDEPWVEPTLAQIMQGVQNIYPRGVSPNNSNSASATTPKIGRKTRAENSCKNDKTIIGERHDNDTPSKHKTPMKYAEIVEADVQQYFADDPFNQGNNWGDLTIGKGVGTGEMMDMPIKKEKTPVRKATKKFEVVEMTAEISRMSASTTYGRIITNDTPSKKLEIAGLVFEERNDDKMMDAPVKIETMDAKRNRKPLAKKVIATETLAKKRKSPGEKNSGDSDDGGDETPSKKCKGIKKEPVEVERSGSTIFF